MYGSFTGYPAEKLQRMREIEPAVDAFECLLDCWYRHELTDEAFVESLKGMAFRREDYDFCCYYGRFNAHAVILFEKKGMTRHLREA